MSISLTEDIRTLAELQSEPMSVVKQARQSGRPVVLTTKGKADVVVMDAAAFEKRLKLANLSRLLMQAEGDVRAGRTRRAGEFFEEFRRAKKGITLKSPRTRSETLRLPMPGSPRTSLAPLTDGSLKSRE